MARDYNAAVQALNTLQSNFAIVDKIRKSGVGMNKNAIPEMIEWVRRSGYEPSDFDRLNPIHIAGTKGKGSTSSFISSILVQHARISDKPYKTGLYTSPHLRFVRERIQIDNKPISETLFAKYFFEVWDRLEAAAKAAGHPNPNSTETKPVYFRYLTLMAFHCYLSEGVDTAVFECGIGGEFDSTNVIVKPSVTAVTSLGIDHTAMLGDTIESIAWHKAGIFKPGVPAFTAPQLDSALKILFERAEERETQLTEVSRSSQIDAVKLGLAGEFQKTNAAVATAAALAHIARRFGKAKEKSGSAIELPAFVRDGLEQVKLGGRCEIRQDTKGNLAWFIDGGHTLESIEMAGRWFATHMTPEPDASIQLPPRVLIFNQQTRDAGALARKLHSSLASAVTGQTAQPFTHVIFCTNTTYVDSGYKLDHVSMNTNSADIEKLSVQNELAKTWAEVDPSAEVEVMRTIEEAVAHARRVSGLDTTQQNQVKVLVTGSLHLVGGVIEVLEAEAEGSQ